MSEVKDMLGMDSSEAQSSRRRELKPQKEVRLPSLDDRPKKAKSKGGVSAREVQQLTRGLKVEELPSLGLGIDEDGVLVDASSAVAAPNRQMTGFIGKNVIFRAPAPVESKFKSQRSRTAVSWQWRPMQSSARPADLHLSHWQRANYNQDYRYAKLNKKIKMMKYTDEEYKFCEHPDWTREETDRLFALCEEYDLRFTLIEDRFNPPDAVRSPYPLAALPTPSIPAGFSFKAQSPPPLAATPALDVESADQPMIEAAADTVTAAVDAEASSASADSDVPQPIASPEPAESVAALSPLSSSLSPSLRSTRSRSGVTLQASGRYSPSLGPKSPSNPSESPRTNSSFGGGFDVSDWSISAPAPSSTPSVPLPVSSPSELRSLLLGKSHKRSTPKSQSVAASAPAPAPPTQSASESATVTVSEASNAVVDPPAESQPVNMIVDSEHVSSPVETSSTVVATDVPTEAEPSEPTPIEHIAATASTAPASMSAAEIKPEFAEAQHMAKPKPKRARPSKASHPIAQHLESSMSADKPADFNVPSEPPTTTENSRAGSPMTELPDADKFRAESRQRAKEAAAARERERALSCGVTFARQVDRLRTLTVGDVRQSISDRAALNGACAVLEAELNTRQLQLAECMQVFTQLPARRDAASALLEQQLAADATFQDAEFAARAGLVRAALGAAAAAKAAAGAVKPAAESIPETPSTTSGAVSGAESSAESAPQPPTDSSTIAAAAAVAIPADAAGAEATVAFVEAQLASQQTTHRFRVQSIHEQRRRELQSNFLVQKRQLDDLIRQHKVALSQANAQLTMLKQRLSALPVFQVYPLSLTCFPAAAAQAAAVHAVTEFQRLAQARLAAAAPAIAPTTAEPASAEPAAEVPVKTEEASEPAAGVPASNDAIMIDAEPVVPSSEQPPVVAPVHVDVDVGFGVDEATLNQLCEDSSIDGSVSLPIREITADDAVNDEKIAAAASAIAVGPGAGKPRKKPALKNVESVAAAADESAPPLPPTGDHKPTKKRRVAVKSEPVSVHINAETTTETASSSNIDDVGLGNAEAADGTDALNMSIELPSGAPEPSPSPTLSATRSGRKLKAPQRWADEEEEIQPRERRLSNSQRVVADEGELDLFASSSHGGGRGFRRAVLDADEAGAESAPAEKPKKRKLRDRDEATDAAEAPEKTKKSKSRKSQSKSDAEDGQPEGESTSAAPETESRESRANRLQSRKSSDAGGTKESKESKETKSKSKHAADDELDDGWGGTQFKPGAYDGDSMFDYKFHWDGFDDFKMIVPPTESVMPVLDLTATDAPQAADVMVESTSQTAVQASTLPRYRCAEELKDRFYSIQRALLIARSEPNTDFSTHPAFAHSFVPLPERHRKTQLARLLLRPLDQDRHISSLVIESRAVDAQLSKLNKQQRQAEILQRQQERAQQAALAAQQAAEAKAAKKAEKAEKAEKSESKSPKVSVVLPDEDGDDEPIIGSYSFSSTPAKGSKSKKAESKSVQKTPKASPTEASTSKTKRVKSEPVVEEAPVVKTEQPPSEFDDALRLLANRKTRRRVAAPADPDQPKPPAPDRAELLASLPPDFVPMFPQPTISDELFDSGCASIALQSTRAPWSTSTSFNRTLRALEDELKSECLTKDLKIHTAAARSMLDAVRQDVWTLIQQRRAQEALEHEQMEIAKQLELLIYKKH